MSQRVYLAIDLGAESGRVMAGLWNGKTLRLEEIHRFPNGPVHLAGSMRWDVMRLWAEIQNGLGAGGKEIRPSPSCRSARTLGAWISCCSARAARCWASLAITAMPGPTG